VEAAEADDTVGGEVRAVLGDEVEEGGAAGARGAGETHGTTTGQQPDQALALVLAFQEMQRGPGRSRRDGRLGRAVHLGTLGHRELLGPPRALARRAGLYLAAVDGVDGEQVVARDELYRARERGRVLAEVGCEGVPGRALARRGAVAFMAVLLGSPLVRVHRFKPPKSVVCASSPSRPCCTPRCRFWSGPTCRDVRQWATEP